jgi:hypothetical protein
VDDNDDKDAAVDDGDRCLGLQDLCSGKDVNTLIASPPSRSFSEVRFLRNVVSLSTGWKYLTRWP